MKKQKPSLLFLPIFLWAFLFSACGAPRPTPVAPEQLSTGQGGDPVQLIIYTPRNLVDDNVITELDEAAGISVIQHYYTSDEELIALATQTSNPVSLIIASNYAVGLLKDRTLLTPYDPNNVPNVNNIDGRFRNLAYDANNQYCAAFTYGTIGLGYINGQGLTPTSWNALFEQTAETPSFGRTSLLAHPREALGAALIYLGFNPNTTETAEINAAKDLIVQHAANFSGVDSLHYWEDLALFKTSLAQGFSRDFLAGQQINAEMNYTLPPEGTLLRIYNFCIPKIASPAHKLAAEVFINLSLDPEFAANSIFLRELPTTVMVDESLIALETLENPFIYPPDNILATAQYIYSLGAQEILYTTAWDDILAALR
ncbi:MAG: extracellular solute-binding protein [Anaerolineales bacterium]|nr:extracellular solute-binding protein [Anaerolineales bacterium]